MRCRIYKKTRPLFTYPCDSRIIGTFIVDARESTIEDIAQTQLKTHAIMVKVGNGSSMCFMSILHDVL